MDKPRHFKITTSHEYRGFRCVTHDDDGQERLWPTWVVGWRSYEFVPPMLSVRLRRLLDEIRRGR